MQLHVPFDSRTYLVPASSLKELSVWMRGTSLDVATSSSIISEILVGQCIQYPNDQCQNNTISLIRTDHCLGKNVPKWQANSLSFSGTRIRQRQNEISTQKTKQCAIFSIHGENKPFKRHGEGLSFLSFVMKKREQSE